ncbi:MAG: DUF4097 family beta strand repeat-containing protein, partial [Lachnospiraceae bacterium]|nr:DUF4097 family beta strand repeat-containing protein [Lachnospiraceae bacterium]
MSGKAIYLIVLSIVTVAVIVFCTTGKFAGLRIGGLGSTVKDTVTFNDDIKDVDIDLDAADLKIEYGDSFTVDYAYPEKIVPTIKVEDGTLKIHKQNGVNIATNGWGNKDFKVTVTVPNTVELEDLRIDVDAGNLDIDDL